MKTSSALLMLVVVPLFACKMLEDKPAANCNASAVPENEFCFEYPKGDYSDAKSLCTKFKGVWSESGGCDRTNALGVCKLGSNNKVFYSGTQFKTADEAKAKCVGKWVGPGE